MLCKNILDILISCKSIFQAAQWTGKNLHIVTLSDVFYSRFKSMWAGVCAQRRELLLSAPSSRGGWHTMLRRPQRRLCGGCLQSMCKLSIAQNHTHKHILKLMSLLKGGEPWKDCGFGGSLFSCHFQAWPWVSKPHNGHLQVNTVCCWVLVCA